MDLTELKVYQEFKLRPNTDFTFSLDYIVIFPNSIPFCIVSFLRY